MFKTLESESCVTVGLKVYLPLFLSYFLAPSHNLKAFVPQCSINDRITYTARDSHVRVREKEWPRSL